MAMEVIFALGVLSLVLGSSSRVEKVESGSEGRAKSAEDHGFPT